MLTQDPFVELVGSVVREATPRRAVVEQPPSDELENHAGAFHAAALFNVGYAASRALIEASLGERAADADASLIESDIAFEKVVMGEAVIATAEPAADGWDALLERLGSGESLVLPTKLTLRNGAGKAVTSMTMSWRVSLPPQSRDDN